MRRRDLLASAAAGALLLPLGPRAWALSGASRQRFVFVFVTGGWDPLISMAYAGNSSVVERREEVVEGTAGNLRFVDHAERPSVRNFFQAESWRTALIHGIEARSVAHDVCLRLMLTGSGRPGEADWGTRLASTEELVLPMVVLSGPAYAGGLAQYVVRLGASQQLNGILDGSALGQLTPSTAPPATGVEELEDAFSMARAEAFVSAAQDPVAADFAQATQATQRAVQGSSSVRGLHGALDGDLARAAAAAFDLFQEDLACAATVEFKGQGDLGADTHADNDILQGALHATLFDQLSRLLRDLDSRVDANGQPLAASTHVVVLSEMGRHPRFNGRDGREHWTFTSALLIGGDGMVGDQVIGDYDDQYRGERVDLRSGRLDGGGASLLPGHLGSTLLHLAGRDGEAEIGVPPISALLA